MLQTQTAPPQSPKNIDPAAALRGFFAIIEAWGVGMMADRVDRLDPQSGTFTEYLLPRPTNMRRSLVDDRTTPVTFWVGSNHGASIVRVEPLD